MEDFKTYTLNEVADILKITVQTVRAYVKNGELKASKIGKYYRVTDENLRAFVENGARPCNSHRNKKK